MPLQIQEVLKQKDLSVPELAKRLDISRAALYYQIKGNPTLETLEKIAKALDVSIIELFKTDSKPLYGFIEFEGMIHKIDNLESIKQLVSLIEGEKPVPDSPI